VPSSANWKPTKPFKSKHQKVALIRPIWIAANHFEKDMLVKIIAFFGYRTYGIYRGRDGNNTGDKKHFHKGTEHIKVEEHDDFFAPYCCVL
jgi:hypothetical protein